MLEVSSETSLPAAPDITRFEARNVLLRTRWWWEIRLRHGEGKRLQGWQEPRSQPRWVRPSCTVT